MSLDTVSHPMPARRSGRSNAVAPPLVGAAAHPATLARRPHDRHPHVPVDLLGAQLARAVARRAPSVEIEPAAVSGPVIQRWWAGIRQLSGMGWLGKPWHLGGNPLGLGGYHKHIFLEDGGTPADIVHMGPEGLGQDTAHSKDEYTRTDEGAAEEAMRRAIARHSPAPPYSLLSDNCQKWVDTVIGTYRRVGGKVGREQAMEMSAL